MEWEKYEKEWIIWAEGGFFGPLVTAMRGWIPAFAGMTCLFINLELISHLPTQNDIDPEKMTLLQDALMIFSIFIPMLSLIIREDRVW